MNATKFLAAAAATCITGRWYVMRSPSDRPHVATARDGHVHLTDDGVAMRDAMMATPAKSGAKRKSKAKAQAPALVETDVDDAGAGDQLELQGMGDAADLDLDMDLDELDPVDESDENAT